MPCSRSRFIGVGGSRVCRRGRSSGRAGRQAVAAEQIVQPDAKDIYERGGAAPEAHAAVSRIAPVYGDLTDAEAGLSGEVERLDVKREAAEPLAFEEHGHHIPAKELEAALRVVETAYSNHPNDPIERTACHVPSPRFAKASGARRLSGTHTDIVWRQAVLADEEPVDLLGWHCQICVTHEAPLALSRQHAVPNGPALSTVSHLYQTDARLSPGQLANNCGRAVF